MQFVTQCHRKNKLICFTRIPHVLQQAVGGLLSPLRENNPAHAPGGGEGKPLWPRSVQEARGFAVR